MEHEELIQDLRQKSRERIRQIWQEAESKAQQLRDEKQNELSTLKRQMQEQLRDETEGVSAPILHDAARTALAVEDEALQRLAERLLSLARSLLPGIREQEYASLVAGFVRELPVKTWEQVRVNPQDMELAGELFPRSEVIPDQAFCGGFVASRDSGRHQVVDTLEGRLEKGWPLILPVLIQRIFEELHARSAL